MYVHGVRVRGERERERGRKEKRKREGEGREVKYQSTSEVLATLNCKYMLGISSFDVSCFITQTLPLMYPEYTGKAHPSLDFVYADTLASHTLLASYPGLGTRPTRFIFTVANIHKYLLGDYREGIPPSE